MDELLMNSSNTENRESCDNNEEKKEKKGGSGKAAFIAGAAGVVGAAGTAAGVAMAVEASASDKTPSDYEDDSDSFSEISGDDINIHIVNGGHNHEGSDEEASEEEGEEVTVTEENSLPEPDINGELVVEANNGPIGMNTDINVGLPELEIAQDHDNVVDEICGEELLAEDTASSEIDEPIVASEPDTFDASSDIQSDLMV